MDKKEIFKRIVDRSIENIIIPSSVTSIGKFCFYNCDKLIELTISNSVKSIGAYAFGYCNNLKKTIMSNNVESIGDGAFSYCNSLTSITIPSSVKSIGDFSFNECDSLIEIIIASGVESIGDSAFGNCNNLTEITIPSSVKSIGDKAFSSGLSALYLKKITFNQPSGMAITLPTAGSSDGLFYCKTASNLTVYTDNETIKNYNYSADNVTATIYHLDGTLWG